MSDIKEQLASILHWGPRPPYNPDPAVLLEAVLREVDSENQKKIAGLYFEAVAASLQANLRFVQGLQAIVAGQED
jgi:hypothetical protein